MMKKGQLKRKRSDNEDLSDFNIIDKEAKHWKYDEEEIKAL